MGNQERDNDTWDYLNRQQYRRRIHEGMPAVIITCAATGEHQKSENPAVPITAEEQSLDAAAAYAAGASIIHVHGRDAMNPTKTSADASCYREVNARIRAQAPEIIIDNTQTADRLPVPDGLLAGSLQYYRSGPVAARPEIMALNPGPMAFRGSDASGHALGSTTLVTTFDDTLRTAIALREQGIKPQVFLYHPGHLDLLEYLIQHDALAQPYFLQLVFGQQSGIPLSPDGLLDMVRNLPETSLFQTCALGLEAIHVNVFALLLGGHVRTGLEDSLLYQRAEAAQSNVQLVARIARIAHELGRRVATGPEARRMLGLGPPRRYEADASVPAR